MRGEICLRSASFLSLVAVILLIFVHVGQINTSSVPRGVSMVKLNMTDYGMSLSQVINPDNVTGLYTTNASAPLQKEQGLRQIYLFGLYTHCAYVINDTTGEQQGICGNQTIGAQFRPYDAIVDDMIPQYAPFADTVFRSTVFQDSDYLGSSTKAAYWMMLLGIVCAALAFITGLLKYNLAFIFSTFISIVGGVLLLIAATIWTVMINKITNINSLSFPAAGSHPAVPSGITISIGPALYMLWAAFVCMIVSILPYMISCCTYRG